MTTSTGSMLTTHVSADHEAASHALAERIVARVRAQPSALLCLATGATPMRGYSLTAEAGARETGLFAHARVIKLDEWGGLPGEDPASCERYLQDALIGPLGMGERYCGFQGDAAKPPAECARVAQWLVREGPIDVAVLGLGLNGHLGFLEPANATPRHAHVAKLSSTSLGHAMLNATTARPSYGLTLGIADLIAADEIVVIATGAAKRDIVSRLLDSPITPQLPATYLHLHARASLLIDEAAAS